ncbi:MULTISPECIES: hypothetical protein [Burkholderia]|nr:MULTISPECIES: hypothetical protein [Burkholderia]CAG2382013.1 hypothetical protein BCCR12632_07160 [Burkholderia cenocepacia]CAG2382015.1 hypothetical protein BCCR75389_07117 [Burkholderia cenocepacia]CAG2382018.1 hypothetical protein BCCR75388_07125 [Burkholderia cenocepacia]CAG2382060.1 hypothetical protein BCCR75384_07151 [Burkholderia cenocepacia]CAG2382126.1 hypothetical protein BCCR75387_07147 [Burkholderia cenocepacia]
MTEISKMEWCDHTWFGAWAKRTGQVYDGSDSAAYDDGDARMLRVGKKLAGRTIDGVKHHAFSKPSRQMTVPPASAPTFAAGTSPSTCSMIQ